RWRAPIRRPGAPRRLSPREAVGSTSGGAGSGRGLLSRATGDRAPDVLRVGADGAEPEALLGCRRSILAGDHGLGAPVPRASADPGSSGRSATVSVIRVRGSAQRAGNADAGREGVAAGSSATGIDRGRPPSLSSWAR